MKISKISKANSEIICRHKSVLELGANYQPETLYYILKKNPQLVNKIDYRNETFLSYAIKRKNEEITKLIINSPILDLSYQDSNGNSYLHLSTMQQLISTTILLLKKGIKINSQNNEGNTALHYAYNFNNKPLISILKEYKADLNIKNKLGKIPEEIELNSLNVNINSSFDEQFYKTHNNFFDTNLSIQLNNNYINSNNLTNTNNNKLNDTNKNSSFKYSLVNFSYSDDEDNKDNKENSDIFNLSNTDTYKKKVKNVININSQTVGEGYNILLDNNKNNKSKNDNGFVENSTSISKEEKDLQIQKSFNNNKIKNNLLNNEDNVYNNYNSNNKSSLYNNNSYKYLEQDFIFSPFDTLKESPNNIQINNEINQFNVNNINQEDSLYKFLSEINLEKKYYFLMNSNGFEDIDLLIEQERTCKLNTSITNSALKEIGIFLPGDRAKILIHLEEKAGNYSFAIPKNVYYFLQDVNNINNDENIKKIFEWLKVIKVENYLDNFIKCGYYSLELILMQMNSKNPINEDIIKDEIGIKKVGHRARVINKLVEDGRLFWNKLKDKTVNIISGQMDKNCDCNIF